MIHVDKFDFEIFSCRLTQWIMKRIDNNWYIK